MRSASEHSGKRRGRKLQLSKAVAAKQILLLAAVPVSIFFALLFAVAFTLVARFLGGWSDDAAGVVLLGVFPNDGPGWLSWLRALDWSRESVSVLVALR